MSDLTLSKVSKWCLHYLMASSIYSDRDVERLSLDVLREMVYRICTLMLPIAMAIGMLLMWDRQDIRLNWLQVLFTAVTTANSWSVLGYNRKFVPLLGLLGIGFVILYGHILTGNESLIYYCLAFSPAFYLLPTEKYSHVATVSNLIWWLSSSGLALYCIGVYEAAIYMSVHGLIWFFLETIFSLVAINEKDLKYQAERDPLTNVYNRRAMEMALKEAISLHERHDITSSLLMIDVDHFKQINDEFGHHEGDQVIKSIADFLSKRLRGADKIFRFGGEEFVVMLVNTRSNHAYLVAESIREQLANTQITSKKRITVSCGVAESTVDDTTDNWLKRCDKALYRAKHSGRDRVELEMPEAPMETKKAGLA